MDSIITADNKRLKEFTEQINEFASKNIPFVFLIDFEMQKPMLSTIENAENEKIFFDFHGNTNFKYKKNKIHISPFKINPISKKKYFKAFKLVQKNILHGNSYLLNLTFPTKIKTNNTLKEIFNKANAPYKVLYKNKFISFSPECFIKIIGNNIYSYPMKGTIDASIKNAEQKILKNKKETNEHNTIVDLIRNDLSIVSSKVKVTKFRYIDKIKTNSSELLQVSSEITGVLPDNWKSQLGNTIIKLLPAGSISGAPKRKTVEIIKEAEKQKRGYYTGIFGVFDGKNLDSAVLIRYIEKKKGKYYFRSGGGITSMSNKHSEYKELIQKIYVPIS